MSSLTGAGWYTPVVGIALAAMVVLVGVRGLWLRVAAASGLAVSLLYSVLSISPIIDVPSWRIFAAKVSGVVIGSNLLGAGLYAVARRRTALVPASVPGDG
jgi:hypothetical protein